MEYVNALLLLHDAVNHPIDVRLAAVEKVTELTLFRGSGATVRLFFEAENSLFEAPVPLQRCVGLPGMNFVVQTGKISLSAGSDVNEVCHAWLRTRRRTLLPAGCGHALHRPGLVESPHWRRHARRCRAGADSPQRPVRPRRLFRSP